jgi:hypothetical protein
MLAYELYLKNKDNAGRSVKSVKPIKKVYVYNDVIELDPSNSEHYDSEKQSKSILIQDLLSMPLNCANEKN